MTTLAERAEALLAAAEKAAPVAWSWEKDGRIQNAFAHNPTLGDYAFWQAKGWSSQPLYLNSAHNMAAMIRELLAENERLRGDYAEKLSALRADAESWRALRKSDGPGTMRNPYALALGADTPLAAPAVDPTLAPYSVSDAGPSPFQGRTTRRE